MNEFKKYKVNHDNLKCFKLRSIAIIENTLCESINFNESLCRNCSGQQNYTYKKNRR